MRIAILPSNPAPIQDRECPKPEGAEQDQSGSAFFAVIHEMASAAGISEPAEEEGASHKAESKDEQLCENSTAASLPAVLVNAEPQPVLTASGAEPILAVRGTRDATAQSDRGKAGPETSPLRPANGTTPDVTSSNGDATAPASPVLSAGPAVVPEFGHKEPSLRASATALPLDLPALAGAAPTAPQPVYAGALSGASTSVPPPAPSALRAPSAIVLQDGRPRALSQSASEAVPSDGPPGLRAAAATMEQDGGAAMSSPPSSPEEQPDADFRTPSPPAPDAAQPLESSGFEGIPSVVQQESSSKATPHAKQDAGSGPGLRAESGSFSTDGLPAQSTAPPIAQECSSPAAFSQMKSAAGSGGDLPVFPAPAATVRSRTSDPQAPAEGIDDQAEAKPQVGSDQARMISAEVAEALPAAALSLNRNANSSSVIPSAENPASREDNKDNQAGRRRAQAREPVAVASQDLRRPADVCRAAPAAPALSGDDSKDDGSPSQSDRITSDSEFAAPGSNKGKSAARPAAADGYGRTAESAWADLQNAQRVLMQDQPARPISSETVLYGPLRPAQHGAATTEASWAAGMQLPAQAAGAELKALSALLTPRHSAASQEPDFLSQLVERIQTQLRDGENIIRIQLKPSSLGRMEIKAETSGSIVLATILTESTGVKAYLEHNLHILQQSFQDHGLKIDRIDVAVQEGFWSPHSSSGNQESRSSTGRQGDSGSSAWHSDALERPGEELVLDARTLTALGPHSTFHTIA